VYKNDKLIEYRLSIPKGFKTDINIYENEKVKVFTYQDSSSIYFSDNTAPSSFYPGAYLKYGEDLNIKFLVNDTLSINGKDDKERYWEDRKVKHIIYGYRKVPYESKNIFDSALNTIRIK